MCVQREWKYLPQNQKYIFLLPVVLCIHLDCFRFMAYSRDMGEVSKLTAFSLMGLCCLD